VVTDKLIAQINEVLYDEKRKTAMTEANYQIAQKYYSLETLERLLIGR